MIAFLCCWTFVSQNICKNNWTVKLKFAKSHSDIAALLIIWWILKYRDVTADVYKPEPK